MTVDQVSLESVLPLRARILRAGQPAESARSRQDDAPGTVHLAARAEDGTVIGVVTLFPCDTPYAPGVSAMRFRGMAVDDALQTRGVGRMLMRQVVHLARDAGARVLWANGRDTALGFYERVGFRVAGDEFLDQAMQLPHHVVIAELDDVTA